MKQLSATVAVFAFVIQGSFALGADSIKVSNAWVRPTVPGVNLSGAYMQIQSERPARLVKVASPIAGASEIHSMEMKDGIMKMREVDAIEIPAGKTIHLKPGGFHLMLMMLKQELKPGQTISLTLTFEDADRKQFMVKVEANVQTSDRQKQKH